MKTEEPETEQELLAPEAQTIDSMTLALLNKSEIDQQIATAKKYKRNLTTFKNLATALVTRNPETADRCVYVLPRDGKNIEGPSARFAESILHAWGNARAGARVIDEGLEFVTSMGSFFDMEQNVHIGYEVKRRITNREGKRYNSDMIATTANAACSIALRNAILKGIPETLWWEIYLMARAVIAGDIKTLDSRRAAAMKQFQLLGARPEQVFALLDVKGIDDITVDHLVTLRGLFNAIREGEITVARAFAPKDTEDKNLAAKSEKNLEEVKKKYAQPEAQKSGASQSTSPVDTPPAIPTAAEAGPPAAPPNVQQSDDAAPASSSAVTAAEPEGHPGDGPSASHGVPDLFDEPAKTKRKR